MKQVSAIVLAAGKGARFKSKASKALVEINSCPLIMYCLKTFCRHPFIKEIIVVANSSNINDIRAGIKKHRIGRVKDVILGGRQRQDSVSCGLKATAKENHLVLIHDAARPFIDKEIVSTAIKEAQKCGAAITGVPAKATIKEVYSSKRAVHSFPFVKKTLNRENLWEIQTPQVFERDLILEAYRKFGNTQVTDDASLVEKLGADVKVVMGSYFNIKVTTPEDLILARAIIKAKKGLN